jgi:hypothetical protein
MPTFAITAVTHDRSGGIIVRSTTSTGRSEIIELLLARSPRQTAVVQSGDVSVAVLAVDSPPTAASCRPSATGTATGHEAA